MDAIEGRGLMAVRYLKIVLVVFVSLQGLLWVIANVTNWSSGLGAVGYVLSMQEHAVYGSHIFVPVTNPTLVKIAFLVILAGESLVGLLSAKGAWDMWTARRESAQAFNSAKTFAVLGTGMAMVVWFGGFTVIGGALFQMWQTEIGAGSFHDAFWFATMGGLVMLFTNMPDA
jgi:predicted small integral membrane protein